MASITRSASAAWTGSGKEGAGSLTTESGRLSATPYSFGARFAGAAGTNPEELIAAAHAGCFTMALALQIGATGHTPERLATEAKVTIDQVDGGFAINTIHLILRGKVPGMSAEQFAAAAAAAKAGCPVSKLFNATISLDAKLE